MPVVRYRYQGFEMEVPKESVLDYYLAHLRNKNASASTVERKIKVVVELLNYLETSGLKIVRRA